MQQAAQVWDMYVGMDTTNLSFNMLNLMANECYKTKQFYYSLKSFDILYNVDPHPDHWNGKRGAICGLIKQHIENNKDELIIAHLQEAIVLLQHHNSTDAVEIQQLIEKYVVVSNS